MIVLGAVLLALADPAGDASVRVHIGLVAAWLACLALVAAGAWAMVRRWRLMQRTVDAWYAAAAVCLAVYLVGFSARLYGVQQSRFAGVEAVADAAMMLLWLVLLVAAVRRATLPSRMGPVALGLVLGVGGAAVEVVVTRVEPVVPRSAGVLVLGAALIPVGIACSVVLKSVPGCDTVARRQLAIAATSGLASRVLFEFSADGRWVAVLAAALAVAASAIFAHECVHLLVLDRRRAHRSVPAQHQPPAQTPNSAEVLHELRASMAGVASAVHVLAKYGDEVTADRRTQLTAMLAVETGRLERLLARDGIDPARELQLDEVIDPVVTARRVTGQVIEWEPAGHVVVGGPDSVRAAINILLVNADVHARGWPVTISTEAAGESVCIRVVDGGPGIPEQVRGSIFDPGVRGHDSHGQGIGLSFAYRLIAAQQGSLRLSSSAASGGACFEVLLPAPSTQNEAG